MANVGTGVEEGGMVMMVGVVGDREEWEEDTREL